MKIYKDEIVFDEETYETTNIMQTDLGTFVSKANVQKKDKNIKSSFIGADVAILKNYSKYMKAKAQAVGHQLEALHKVYNSFFNHKLDYDIPEIDEAYTIIENKIKAYENLQKKYHKEAKTFREAAIRLVKERRKEVAYLKRVQRKMYRQAQLRKELEEYGDSDTD